MKLKTFKVVGVWGALTKEISFRDHTTFLIGINGSGKTTVLNLLDGLLKPNLKKLLFVDFKEVSLILSDDDTSNSISKIVCKKYDDRMVIFFQNQSKHIYEEHRVNYDGIEFPTKKIERSDYERLEYFFQKSEVYSLIKELPTPVIVGLNRLLTDADEDDTQPIFHTSIHHSMPLSLINQNDDISEALKNVRDLIYDHIRENARKQSSLADEFKNQVFDEMLTPPIIRKTKCYRFTKRNVPKRKTKRLRYRCPPEPYSNSVRTDFFSYSNAIILENQQINTGI